MTPEMLREGLERAEASGSFLDEAGPLLDRLDRGTADLALVEVLLRFMEQHPSLDHGAPGPLVHFAEAFYGRGYEALLLESLSRQPIAQTVWMLNRVINGTKDGANRKKLLDAMRVAGRHPNIDLAAKRLTVRFLELGGS